MLKKSIITLVCILSLGAVIGGVILIKKSSDAKKTVDVIPVSSILNSWYGEELSLSGIVMTDISQKIFLTKGQSVEEIFVQEGDHVKIGDPVMTYDSTLTNIKLEMEKLNQEMMDVQLEAANITLEKLLKETPIPDYYASKTENSGFIQVAATPVIETETEQPIETDPMESSTESEIEKEEPYTELNYDSLPYKGEGTNESPYVFLCTEGTIIKGSFFNKMRGYDAKGEVQEKEKGFIFVLEVKASEDGYGEQTGLAIKGEVLDAYQEDWQIIWSELRELIKNKITGEDVIDDVVTDFPGIEIAEEEGGDSGYSIPEGYTKDELNKLIFNQRKEIKNLELSKEESILKSTKIEKELEKLAVTSSINGVVAKAGDPEKGADADGSAFLILNSEEGIYVKGTLSELALENISVGDTLQGMSLESNASFTAEIKEISEYPEESEYYQGGNYNASYYSFIAYIEETNGVRNNEYVSLSMMVGGDTDFDTLYITKAFVREEGGKSYVYIADADGYLVKRYITTGKILGGYAIEVKSGLTLDDNIAFPYGKNLKEGTKTVITDISSLYQ